MPEDDLSANDEVVHRQLMDRAFAIHPFLNWQKPIYKRTEIWVLLKDVKRLFVSDQTDERLEQDDSGLVYELWRENRKNAIRVREQMPDLTEALDEYRKNIGDIADIAKKRDTELILLTQPSIWREDLPARLEELLWMGGIGEFQKETGKEYYSVQVLANSMAVYNDALLGICRNRNLHCIDLARSLPRDDSVFYDDVHFNESGAVMVADVLADYIIEHSMLKE